MSDFIGVRLAHTRFIPGLCVPRPRNHFLRVVVVLDRVILDGRQLPGVDRFKPTCVFNSPEVHPECQGTFILGSIRDHVLIAARVADIFKVNVGRSGHRLTALAPLDDGLEFGSLRVDKASCVVELLGRYGSSGWDSLVGDAQALPSEMFSLEELPLFDCPSVLFLFEPEVIFVKTWFTREIFMFWHEFGGVFFNGLAIH